MQALVRGEDGTGDLTGFQIPLEDDAAVSDQIIGQTDTQLPGASLLTELLIELTLSWLSVLFDVPAVADLRLQTWTLSASIVEASIPRHAAAWEAAA